jgi:FlaG/FlaF family flagellin (archaellin)
MTTKTKPEKLYAMTLAKVPYSSIVGQSMTISHPKFGVVAQLAIMVPQTRMDYRTVADAVADALIRGHVSKDGVTLVLPADFVSPTTP